jgi:hypothetical protein
MAEHPMAQITSSRRPAFIVPAFFLKIRLEGEECFRGSLRSGTLP